MRRVNSHSQTRSLFLALRRAWFYSAIHSSSISRKKDLTRTASSAPLCSTCSAPTRRLAPAICDFTSQVFYERRLKPKPGLENQLVTGVEGLNGNGLWYLDIDHDGRTSASDEEVHAVESLVSRLLSPGAMWVSEKKKTSQLEIDDILVVSPFNAQVSRLRERLPAGARVGTVDKFQGQAAPVVIYSMATSRPEDAPRGMEFLYSLNRLNVATSRAKCAVIIVASPRLYAPECRSPRQMKLANALCRYREMAKIVAS